MTRTVKKGILIAAAGILLAGPALATDYQSMSLSELDALRGTMATADTAEREAFRSARQEKMRALSPEERSSYIASSGNRYGGQGSGNGNGSMTRSRLRDGSGSGSMHKYGGSGSASGMGGGHGHRGGRGR